MGPSELGKKCVERVEEDSGGQAQRQEGPRNRTGLVY